MERVNYGGSRMADCDAHREDDSQEGHEAKHRPWRNQKYHDRDENYSGRGHEKVEHPTGYAANDSAQSGFDDEVGWWTKKRRGKRGRRVPPDRRGLMAPVFVPVADPEAKAELGSKEDGNQRMSNCPVASKGRT